MNRLTTVASLLVLIWILGSSIGVPDEETYFRTWGQNWYRTNGGFIIYGYYAFLEPIKCQQVASSLCVVTGSDYVIKTGSQADLFQIWCHSSDCSKDRHLGASYTTSTLKSNGATITWQDDGDDLSYANRGVYIANKGYGVNTHYFFKPKDFKKTNYVITEIPLYFVCFEKLSNSLDDVGLDWGDEIDDTWYRKEYVVYY